METEAIYPLEFSAQLFYRLWGGHQLKTRLGKSVITLSVESLGKSLV